CARDMGESPLGVW
nr:immunoglobulin heavy chain junction region [Macaca mulatta]MOW90977.1 immunoglobulin heavy chain junction region [Macaca mulatta]